VLQPDCDRVETEKWSTPLLASPIGPEFQYRTLSPLGDATP
jgi:hypothetical protein